MQEFVDAIRELADKFPAGRELLDLKAQQDMAVWAERMFWATLCSVAVSAAALVGLFRSLSQTARAIEDNREIGEAETGAYVHAKEAREGRRRTILLECENTGATPARHFSVGGTVKKVKTGQVESSIAFEDWPRKTWSALAGGSSLTVSIDLEMHRNLLDDFFSREFEPDDVLVLMGTIRYTDVYDREFETQFAFFVDVTNPDRFRRPTSKLKVFERIDGRRKG